jgi:hypothetical protein
MRAAFGNGLRFPGTTWLSLVGNERSCYFL